MSKKSREMLNAEQRARRKENGNIDTHKYEKTINGFLMRAYRNMESRVTGIQQNKKHLYLGKELFDRNEFYDWAKSGCTFYILYKRWALSGYSRKLCPTVDRIDSSKGYLFDNVHWLTHSENSKRGSANRHGKNICYT